MPCVVFPERQEYFVGLSPSAVVGVGMGVIGSGQNHYLTLTMRTGLSGLFISR